MKIPIQVLSGILVPLCLSTTGCTTNAGPESPNGGAWFEVKAATPVFSIDVSGGTGGARPPNTPATGNANQGGTIKKDTTPKAQTTQPTTGSGTTSSDGSVLTGTSTVDDGSTWSGSMTLDPDANGDYTLWNS